MSNYIVSDTNLTAVADAIRTKGGTSSALEFPDGFVQAIGDIQTGGGSSVTVEALSVTENGTYTAPTGKAYSPVTVNVSGGGTDELLLLEQNQLTSRTSTAAKIPKYLFAEKTALTSVSYPNATEAGVYCFSGCTNLTTVDVPKLTSVGSSCFYNCTKLVSLDLPAVVTFGSNSFESCTNLVSVSINPRFEGSGATSVFRNCSNLELLDLQKLKSVASSMFGGCSKLAVLVLRKSGAAGTLSNINAFTGTPFASSGTGGTLYVPQDLIASYQSAKNWSTILGYPNNQIKAIEGSEYE